MKKITKKITAAAMLAVSLILNTVMFFILPDQIAMQITYNGAKPTTLPKPLGLLLLVALTALVDYIFYKSEDKSRDIKYLVFTAIVLVLTVLTMIINL